MPPTVSFHPASLSSVIDSEMLQRVLGQVLPGNTVGEVWVFHVSPGKPIEISLFMWGRSPALARLPMSWLLSAEDEPRVRQALEEALRDASATALTSPPDQAG